MDTRLDAEAQARPPLSRERVLRAAVALADAGGVESLSMRRLAQQLGVVPMALYKHVANKDELLDGMIDLVVGEIDPPAAGADWKAAIRQRVLSARRALLRHRWASRVLESRTEATPAVLAYMDSMIGAFRAGGFSIDLTHHAIHAMGSRLLGFSQELFDDTADVAPEQQAAMLRALAGSYPNIAELVSAITPTTRRPWSARAATTSSSSSSPSTCCWTASSGSGTGAEAAPGGRVSRRGPRGGGGRT